MTGKPETLRLELRLDVEFSSSAVHRNFMACIGSKKCIRICSIENSRFQGEAIMNGDGHRSSSITDPNPNPNVEHQPCQNKVVSSPDQLVEDANISSDVMVTGSVSAGNKEGQAARDNINAKSSMDDSTQLANTNLSDNMEESTPYTYQQLQDEQTQLGLTNAVVDDADLSTVDSSSHSHFPPSMHSSHRTTNSDHTALDQGKSNTAAGLPFNKRRASLEQIEQRKYTVHCILHGIEKKEPLRYDETFASEFEQFLSKKPYTEEEDDYMWYIEDHLRKKQCPSFCGRLWKFCTANNLCNLYEFADEGLLLHSKKRKKMVGSFCTDFVKLKDMRVIGKGAFGTVYLYTSTSEERFAIKKEYKLINNNPDLFKKILELKHPHVIETLEYLVAYSEGDKRKSYLLVMPFMNRKGLDKQFKKDCDSVLAYMAKYPDQMKYIFYNFLEIFHQVFKGLDYLKTQKLVHRDVKSSNILVQQNCSCDNLLMCNCSEGKIHCVLGDMNLLCDEGESSLITSEVWHRMAQNEPAGTPRMKPPESFYRTGEGDPVISHKSDIWSGCVTMINVLIGKGVNEVPDVQIGIFLRTATKTVGNASEEIDSCSNTLKDINEKYKSILEGGSVVTAAIAEMNALLTQLEMLYIKLDNSSKALKKVQAFQGGVPEARGKESPLAGILFTVYVANNMHWKCLTMLPDVYGTPLWKHLCDTLDTIADGVRFIPENRKDASEIVELLRSIETAVMV